MYCESCGSFINPGEAFCSNCGSPAPRDSAPAAPSPAPAPAPAPQATSSAHHSARPDGISAISATAISAARISGSHIPAARTDGTAHLSAGLSAAGNNHTHRQQNENKWSCYCRPNIRYH